MTSTRRRQGQETVEGFLYWCGRLFGIEEVKVWGENVLSFKLQVGVGEEDR